jgi:hypothetical protein
VTDRAVDVCNIAVQVFGGYGYTSEFPVAQILRDVRVTSIYEGTNGIQAMDLLGRKLLMKEGILLYDLTREMRKTLAMAERHDFLTGLAERFEKAMVRFVDAAVKMTRAAQGENASEAYAFAGLLLEVTGDVILAWMLLWRTVVAGDRLENEIRNNDADFYKGQIKSAEFFIHTILPVTHGKMDAIMDFCSAAITISDASFGGK